MIPYWLKPNKAGVAILAIFAMLILFLFGFFDIILPNQPLYLCWIISVIITYPISMILGIRVGKKMKILLGVVLVVTLSLLLFSACPILSGRTNIGSPFGYYGKYNRVRSKLKRVPGIKIVSTHLHRDLSLEDFGFVLQTDNGLRFRLQFSDNMQTYETFKHARWLLIVKGQKRTRYSLVPSNRLEESIGQNIRNTFDILRNFGKIAEIVESDRREGVADSSFKDAPLPKDYLYIFYPLSY